MTRNTNRILTALAAGLVALALSACAANKEKKEPGPQALGYAIMNSQGEPLYCKQSRPTGSNVARTTRCMTARDWQAAHDNDQRTLEELRRGYDAPRK